MANLFIAPADSLVFTNGVWSVAPSWLALTTAQQVAASLAFAQQATRNLGLLNATQNGTNAPAIINRPPRVQAKWGNGRTLQAEAVGNYNLGWATIKPLVGVLYDSGYDNVRNRQNSGNAASPAQRTWDVDPASPTYFVNPYNPGYAQGDLTLTNSYTSAFTSDQAIYGLINSMFFHDQLILIGGLRYNQSQAQTKNYLGNPWILQGLRAHYTTPQVGIGYKLLPDLMLYGSYSRSFTLPAQTFLTVPGTVNGLPGAVPSGPSSPTTGEGYETGLKTNFLQGRIATTGSVYQIEQDKVVSSLNQTINGIGPDHQAVFTMALTTPIRQGPFFKGVRTIQS